MYTFSPVMVFAKASVKMEVSSLQMDGTTSSVRFPMASCCKRLVADFNDTDMRCDASVIHTAAMPSSRMDRQIVSAIE